MSPLDNAREIDFPKVCDPRGNLAFAEAGRHVPFPIRRVFYVFDVPGGESRGGHAHKECRQILAALSGSFTLRLTDGFAERTFRMDRASRGVLVPPGVWATMTDFTTGTVMLSLASELYDEEDYIRDFDAFLEYARINNNG